MDVAFCLDALDEALEKGNPSIFNTDQGSQFTSSEFTQKQLDNNIQISMDGRGRFLDNIFIERLWRTVKYEEIYMKGYETVSDAESGLETYFPFYNAKRIHQNLDYRTPEEVHFT